MSEKDLRSGFSMTFSEALSELQNGKCLSRFGWNGKGMYIFQMPALLIRSEDINDRMKPKLRPLSRLNPLKINSYISMYNSRGEIQPGWIASQEDMLADDWGIVDLGN